MTNKVRIAVARDKAFCFYYEDNLEILEQHGAEIIPFSPLCDELPKNISGIYVGGGYPELYAEKISKNQVLIEQIRTFAKQGGMIYGECGGLMYLSQGIQDIGGNRFPLCGIFDFWTEMVSKCQLGYCDVVFKDMDPEVQQSLKGHFFHYSKILGDTDVKQVYTVTTSGGKSVLEGYTVGNVLASYVHLHFGSQPEFSKSLIKRCERYECKEKHSLSSL